MPRKKKSHCWTHRKKRVNSSKNRTSKKERQKQSTAKYKKKKKALKEKTINHDAQQIIIPVQPKQQFIEKIVQKTRRRKRQKLNGIGLLLMAANDIAAKETKTNQSNNTHISPHKPSFESLLPSLI